MKAITLLIKPASSLCNMHCRYCFYKDVSEKRSFKNLGRMSIETARRLIQSSFSYVGRGGAVQFLFQGGEPTLAGLDFFKEFIMLEDKHRLPGLRISHSIQTNGINLTPEWADFFREHQFLVGLSIDGTKDLHDRFRVDADGNGSFHRAVQALALLDERRVDTNLLCVVTGDLARSPEKIYRSLRQLGDHPLQFIPCLDPLEENRGACAYSLLQEAYGSFLKGLFDCWYRDWVSGHLVSVRMFDDCIRMLLGMPPSSCAAAGFCGSYLVAEGDGSLYPCDFYVLDKWRIGSIHTTSVEEALLDRTAQKFLLESRTRPADCETCPVLALCRGGCRRDWIWESSGPENYYCHAFRDFYSYALPRLQIIAGQYARMIGGVSPL